jgi:triacylglycerol lipase
MVAEFVLTQLVSEAASTARCVVRYPLGITERALTTGARSDGPVHDTPVLLIHGYGHNQSGWWALDRHLRLLGHTSVHRMNYLPLGAGVPALAERLAGRVEEIRSLTGAPRIHVVAHSLGGILLRWYVQELGGDRTVDVAITLATPHEGTSAAYLWPERTARQLRPGSRLVRRLASGAQATPVRWIAFWSDADVLVRPHTAGRLVAPVLEATNVRVHGIGHLSFLFSNEVIGEVATALSSVASAADLAETVG